MTELEEYPLHRAAFFNDTQSIARLINDGCIFVLYIFGIQKNLMDANLLSLLL